MGWVLPAVGSRRPMKLKLKIFLLVTTVACVALSLLGGAAVWTAGLSHEAGVGGQNLKLAQLIAAMPQVQEGLAAADPVAALQPLTESLRRQIGVDLIVVFDMFGIRYTHYDERYLNTLYSAGDEARALRGETDITKCSCVGVQSVRGLAPIFGPDGRQIGVVVVGTFVDNVAAGMRQLKMALGVSLALSVGLAAAAGLWIAGEIKRSLRGLEPLEIATLLRERETLFQSMREGVVAIDRHGRITLANEGACTLIGSSSDPVGHHVSQLAPELRLTELLSHGTTIKDEELVLGQSVVVCNRVPITVDGEVIGALATLRDKTEVTRLAEELTGVRRFVQGLRAQNHEFLNKLQTLMGLLHLESYEEAKQFISQTTRGRQEVVHRLLASIGDPATAGLLLGKFSEAQEKGVEMVITPDSRLSVLPSQFDSHAMVCVLGNLVENALEALGQRPAGERTMTVTVRQDAEGLLLKVSDNGPGIPAGARHRIFRPGYSSKGAGRGLGLYLALERVRRAGGEIRVESSEGGGARFAVRIPVRADLTAVKAVEA